MRSSLRGLLRRAQVDLDDVPGPLSVDAGGTGLMALVQGDTLYASATNTLVALAKNANATRYLSNTGGSNNPAWAQVNLTNGVTGTLPAGNLPSATETASGIVELATNAEAVTGTDTTRPVVPAALTARLAAPGPIGGTTPAAISGTTGTFSGLLDLSGASAGQIKFPATANPAADANTLSDFERGTWTPIDSSGAGLSFTGPAGSYEKIDRMFRAGAILTYPATADVSSAKVGGVPFTVSNNGYARQGFITYSNTNLANFILPDANATTFLITSLAGAALTNLQMSSSVFIATVLSHV